MIKTTSINYTSK